MTNYGQIPSASQPKEPVRLIDIKEILQYDGAHFTWSGGRNCLSEQKAAYARGYDAGMKFIVDEVKKAPIIDPESLRPTAEWEVSDWAELKDGEFIHYPDMAIRCSNCLYNFKESELECRSDCPHCGARMVNADD